MPLVSPSTIVCPEGCRHKKPEFADLHLLLTFRIRNHMVSTWMKQLPALVAGPRRLSGTVSAMPRAVRSLLLSLLRNERALQARPRRSLTVRSLSLSPSARLPNSTLRCARTSVTTTNKPTVRQAVESIGASAPKSWLSEMGFSERAIESAVRRGEVVWLRNGDIQAVRRALGRPPRSGEPTSPLTIRVTNSERAKWESAAGASELSDWIRATCTRVATTG